METNASPILENEHNCLDNSVIKQLTPVGVHHLYMPVL